MEKRYCYMLRVIYGRAKLALYAMHAYGLQGLSRDAIGLTVTGICLRLQPTKREEGLRVLRISDRAGKSWLIVSLTKQKRTNIRFTTHAYGNSIRTAHFIATCLLIKTLVQGGSRTPLLNVGWAIKRTGEKWR